ncbi:MAG: hypothetical protein KKA73_10920 [Chloroflexi bacterium]|nr:hypothetical protein [Chloroflexota bacterium]MBU1748188.1 hypothetical protein [Chloroflexota bacterium]MBU1880243.1 hypothetical protein [Chloroflexota bacterium]
MDTNMVCLGTLALTGLVVAGAVSARAGFAVWLALEQTRLTLAGQRLSVEEQRLSLDRARLQLTQEVHADPNGVFPLLWDGARVLDPNRGVVFTITEGAQVLTPGLVQPEQLARILRAGGGWPGGKAAQDLIDRPQVTTVWPAQVDLAGLLQGPPSVRSLVLGVAVNHAAPPQGTTCGKCGHGPEPASPGVSVVRADMEDLVHIAVGGSSGWGKSMFLCVLAYQLALSTEPVDLALVDLEGVTFAPFSRSDRLLWPVADDEGQALAVFQGLTGEMERRKGLFATCGTPGVDKLSLYNTIAAEPLPPVVCLIDEATALLEDKAVESALRTLVLRARKYGLWVVIGGQNWRATSIDAGIRDMLSTRVQFKAKSASQSHVLLDASGAEDITEKGRALAWLPGRDLLELQAPYIDRRAILAAVTGAGPRAAAPTPTGAEGYPQDTACSPAQPGDGQAARILELAAQGASIRAIGKDVFGYVGGHAYDTVKAVLEQAGITYRDTLDGPAEAVPGDRGVIIPLRQRQSS